MIVLLDANALLWWLNDNPALSARSKAAIADPANDILFSAVSIYELVYKRRLGKLDEDVGALRPAAEADGFVELPVTAAHAERAAKLEWNHRDPWDRLIAAQAEIERCALASVDRQFDALGLERIW